MDEALLDDIRTLQLGKRAREIRMALHWAESEEDIEEVELNGEMHRVLTKRAAFRGAIEEMKANRALIAELLKG